MSTQETEVTEYIEYGYRLPDGTHVWQVDHGSDGTWIPAYRYEGRLIPAIDIFADVEHMQLTKTIGYNLQLHVNGGHVLARTVREVRTTSPIEWAEVQILPAVSS